MKSYPFRTPYLFTKLFPNLTWKVNTLGKKLLYLTFDDGPDPEVTPFVLGLLKKYEARATFFVVGNNVSKYPEIIAQIQSEGHAVGNHTFQHLSGWRSSNDAYKNDIAACDKTIVSHSGSNHLKMFRPPYGRITPKQMRLLKHEYKIIMWSMLSGDFDKNLNIASAKRSLNKAKQGEVIVFHDSQKSLPNLKQLLPWFLESFHRKGYKFAALSPQQ